MTSDLGRGASTTGSEEKRQADGGDAKSQKQTVDHWNILIQYTSGSGRRKGGGA
jgi:hypothetical protein